MTVQPAAHSLPAPPLPPTPLHAQLRLPPNLVISTKPKTGQPSTFNPPLYAGPPLHPTPPLGHQGAGEGLAAVPKKPPGESTLFGERKVATKRITVGKQTNIKDLYDYSLEDIIR